MTMTHRPDDDAKCPADPTEPASTALLDAARIGSAALVEAALADVRSRSEFQVVEFVGADEPHRLPDPEKSAGVSVVPVVDGGRTVGWLTAPNTDETRLRPWAIWLGHWLGLALEIERLNEMAYSDELTDAGNRRDFERFLPSVIEDAKVRGRPLSLMVFDIDNFKRYNDHFGHDAGDAVLVETVALLKSVVRKGDRVFRIGGDEFVVVFSDREGPRTPGPGHIESVDQLVGRFRDRVAQLSLPQLGASAPGSVTISAGLSTFPWDGQDGRSLVAHADRLAIESKRRGKNIITFGASPSSGSDASQSRSDGADTRRDGS